MTTLLHAIIQNDAKKNFPMVYFITPLGKEKGNEPYCADSHLSETSSRQTRKMGIYLMDMGAEYKFNQSLNRDLFQMVDYVLASS